MPGRGPAPKAADQRARRNATFAMTQLPAEGRKGRTPAWPLVDDMAAVAELGSEKQLVKQLLAQVDGCEDRRELAALMRQLDRATRRVVLLDGQIKAQRRLERQVCTLPAGRSATP